MKRKVNGYAGLSVLLLMSFFLYPLAVQAKWRIGDERYYNDNKVCRDGMELGLADADRNNTPPVVYKNIGATLYTTGFTPLPDVTNSSTFSPASNFGSYVALPRDITIPDQGALFTLPDGITTTVYLTTTLRWSRPITPGLTIVMSRNNEVNGGGENDAFFTTTVADCYLVAPPTITTQPANKTISSGQSATLSVVASGGGTLVYQWYQGESGDTSTPIGSNTPTHTTPALTATTRFWVRVSNETASVDSATAIVSTLPSITTGAADQTITSGQSATLQVMVTGEGRLTYQWYQGAPGDTSRPVGSNSPSYTTPPLTVTTRYWVRVSNSAGSVDSGPITVTVGTFKVYLPVVRK